MKKILAVATIIIAAISYIEAMEKTAIKRAEYGKVVPKVSPKMLLYSHAEWDTNGVDEKKEIINQILESGEVNLVITSDKGTAFHAALDLFSHDPKFYTYVLNRLVDARANINAKDKNGNTPLMRAIELHRPAAVINLLLRLNPDLHLRNGSDQTVFDVLGYERIRAFVDIPTHSDEVELIERMLEIQAQK